MNAIRATVRNGRIEPAEALNLPEGTEVLVLPCDAQEDSPELSDDSPAGIAEWLRWYESLQPLIFTAEDREEWEKDRRARKQWELAHADERDQKLREMWE